MIRILIADDHRLVREGLRRLFDGQPGLSVVGEAASASELFDAVQRLQPTLALLDVSMPGPGVIETLRTLRERWPALRVVVLSMHSEEQYARRVLRAGAHAYLTKDEAPETVLAAVRTVGDGRFYVPPSVGAVLAAGLDTPEAEALSDREFQVLRMLAAGSSVKRIASTLALSPKTVSTYRSRLMEKLRLGSTADLVRYAVEHGLID